MIIMKYRGVSSCHSNRFNIAVSAGFPSGTTLLGVPHDQGMIFVKQGRISIEV